MYLFLFLCISLAATIYRRIRGIKVDAFSCGLFGLAATKPIDSLMTEKIKALGLFNQNRGKDSCGYFNGEEIFKGADKEKEFFEFVCKNGIKIAENGNNIFIGHTRQSTYGASTIANAHPFNVNERLIIAHNGTISNIWTLCWEHSVDSKPIDVDSLALGHILEKDGPGVLNEYEGYAALLLHELDKPNIMRVYHGMSKEYTYCNEVEERPLFWMKTPEGVYLSSLIGALNFIRNKETDEEPEVVPYNQIIKIENGVVSDEMPYKVNRGDCNIKKYPAPATTTYTGANNNTKQQNTPTFSPTRVVLDITKEMIPFYALQDNEIVYFHQGRYKQGGKLCHGKYICDKKTGMVGNAADFVRSEILYIIQGVPIEKLSDFEKLLTAYETKSGRDWTMLQGNFAKVISEYSKYPVTNLTDTEAAGYSPSFRTRWYENGDVCKAFSLSPKLSSREYKIKYGDLVSIKSTDSTETKLMFTDDSEEEFDEDVESIAKRFEKIFTDENQFVEEIGEFGMEALDLYAEDLIEVIYGEKSSDNLVAAITQNMIMDCITKKVAITELMTPDLGDIKGYIKCIIEEYAAEESDDDKILNQNNQDMEDAKELMNTSQKQLFNEERENEELDLIKQTQDEEAVEKLDQIIKAIKMLSNIALDYEMLDQSSLASKVARDITVSNSLVISQLSETFGDARKSAAVIKLKETLSL
jgi:hypothetical protein